MPTTLYLNFKLKYAQLKPPPLVTVSYVKKLKKSNQSCTICTLPMLRPKSSLLTTCSLNVICFIAAVYSSGTAVLQSPATGTHRYVS